MRGHMILSKYFLQRRYFINFQRLVKIPYILLEIPTGYKEFTIMLDSPTRCSKRVNQWNVGIMNDNGDTDEEMMKNLLLGAFAYDEDFDKMGGYE